MSIEVDNIETCARTAMGELLIKADSNQLVKRVLTAFDINASKTAQLKSLSSFRLEFLEACGEFLGINLADSEDNKIFTKESLQSRILLGINALLPATCSECSTNYRNPLEPEVAPAFHCYMCFQGSHNCPAMQTKVEVLQQNNVVLPSGSIWLCHACLNKSNPVVPRKSKSRHTSVSSTITNSRPPSSLANQIDEQNSANENQHNSDHNDEDTPVCEKYKVGKCPHGLKGNQVVEGITCPKAHPKRCLKFCRNGKTGRHGCKLGASCRFYHPVLCKFSVQKRICTNDACTFVHLKGTKRKQPTTNRNRSVSQHEQTRSQSHRSQNAPGSSNQNLEDPNTTSDHFLELKNVVLLMNSNIQKQQQELSFLRSQYMQLQQVQSQAPVPQNPPLYNPMHQFSQVQHMQNLPVHSIAHPNLTFIPQSSC